MTDMNAPRLNDLDVEIETIISTVNDFAGPYFDGPLSPAIVSAGEPRLGFSFVCERSGDHVDGPGLDGADREINVHFDNTWTNDLGDWTRHLRVFVTFDGDAIEDAIKFTEPTGPRFDGGVYDIAHWVWQCINDLHNHFVQGSGGHLRRIVPSPYSGDRAR